jgi:hypothetical protein
MPNKTQTTATEQVTQDTLETILKLAHSGLSPEDISFAIMVAIETVQQIIAHYPKHTQQLKTSDLETAQLHEDTLPTFIYSYDEDQLHRTNLVTGEQSSHQVPYQFKDGSCWSEVPGGSLLFTGGIDEECMATKEVVRIDALREFAVSNDTPMLTPRGCHAAVYHSQHLYILGGENTNCLSECERYVCAESRWQPLPPLPRACSEMSGVVVESSLYALGGMEGFFTPLDLVQKLSLEGLTWELMQLRLPYAGQGIPCFKLRDTEVYLVVKNTLCLFTGLRVHLLKTLTEGIRSYRGESYYCRGTLYCCSGAGEVHSLEIGRLVTSAAYPLVLYFMLGCQISLTPL